MRDDLYAIRLTVFQVGLDVGTEEITEVVPTIRACVVFLFDKPVHDPCDAQAIRVNCMPTFTLHFSSVECDRMRIRGHLYHANMHCTEQSSSLSDQQRQ